MKIIFTRFYLSLFLLFICKSLSAQLLINEFSCSNFTTYTDAFGSNEDWIEIYNSSASPINLAGYYLSDKSGNLTKWTIPSGNVAANGYVMVSCSRRNTVSGNELHPNFALTQTEGDWIILSNSLGNVIDSLKINTLTKANHSFGRTTDGATTWSLFTTPTPNASNTGAVNYYTAKPVFNLQAGFYPGAQSVSITCPDAGATIRFTLDGSDPVVGSTAYSGPINITATTVLRAAAFSSNLPSFTETNTYFIGVDHTMPVVSVSSATLYNMLQAGSQNPSNRIGSFEIFEEDNSFIDEGEGDFNKHGNDSWAYDQRGFDFIMRDQYGYNDDIEHQIFPESTRDNFQRLILKPAANDNYSFENGAHIRDAFVHTLSIRADLKLDERTWRPCILYLNGEYWGVYELREKIDDADYTEYYFDQDKFNIEYLKTWGATWEEYGAPNSLNNWNALRNYIQTNNMGVAANFNYVDSLLNWESMVDYFVFNSYIVSQDWLNWNTAWWRGLDPNGDKKKWRYTLWDMDASFGHYINYTGIPDVSANADPCNAENLPDPGGQGHTAILQKLINENPQVEQFYITRYADLINTYFSCQYMNFLLDSMINEIEPEMPGQIAKWGGTMAGWQSRVQQLKDFIDLRCTALEAGLISCYNLSGPYAVTYDVSPVGAGQIKANSTWLPTYPFSGTYFGGIQTLLKAGANSGYVFDHWEYLAGPLDLPIDSVDNSLSVTQPETITAVFRVVNTPPLPPTLPSTHGVNIPTGFSPNGDGQNDFLRPIVGDDVKSFVLYIYDRWGNRILQSSDPALTWKGDYNGSLLNSGAYAYLLEIIYNDNTQESNSGNITILR